MNRLAVFVVLLAGLLLTPTVQAVPFVQEGFVGTTHDESITTTIGWVERAQIHVGTTVGYEAMYPGTGGVAPPDGDGWYASKGDWESPRLATYQSGAVFVPSASRGSVEFIADWATKQARTGFDWGMAFIAQIDNGDWYRSEILETIAGEHGNVIENGNAPPHRVVTDWVEDTAYSETSTGWRKYLPGGTLPVGGPSDADWDTTGVALPAGDITGYGMWLNNLSDWGGFAWDDYRIESTSPPVTTFTSILTGTWDTVGTWDEGSTIPAAANPVIVADGHVVTVASADANADAESVSVEGTGQLVVESPRILGVTNAVAIGPNATLSGDGQIIPTEVEVEGTIAAGASAGTLTIGAAGTGDLTLAATGTLLTEVGDLVDVAGAVTIEDGATLALDDPGIIDDKLDPRIGQKTQIVLQGASIGGAGFGSNVPTAGDTPGSGLFAGTPTHDGGGNLTGFTGPVVTENAADVQLTAFQALAGDSNLDSLVDVNDRIIWNSNKFTSGKTWTDADWTGEGDVDVNDRIKWNTNKFTDYTSAAAAGLAGEALAAAVGEPEFVYDALTGELSVITNGHYMTDMIVNFTGDQSAAHPALKDNNFFQNDLAANVFYDGQWFAGSWQLFDSFSNGDNGDSEPNGAATNPDGQMLLLTGLPLGLTSGDFGAASWGDFDGAAGSGEVTIVVPEPGTLLLLLAGLCGLLLWRRR